jgi:4-hydroxybenzoate polyprenyltransferase
MSRSGIRSARAATTGFRPVAALGGGDDLPAADADEAIEAAESTGARGGVLTVDLDAVLLRTNLLHEIFWAALGQHWTVLPEAFFALRRGKQAARGVLDRRADLDVTTLPYDHAAVAQVRAWRKEGGRAVLVTAANTTTAERVTDHLGIFDDVAFGEADRPQNDDAAATHSPERRLGHSGLASAAHVRAMRPHQWLKNLLVFVPMFAAHRIEFDILSHGMIAFIAFCLTASSVYILNDLLDLRADRLHPRKRLRPLAAGDVPIAHGSVMAAGLWLSGVTVAAMLGIPFLLALLGYTLATSVYSLYLQRKPMIDICMLAGLYTIRIIAGGVASGIKESVWLLAFSIFFFLALAAVKRQAELSGGIAAGSLKVAGRGYLGEDFAIVSQMAVSAGYVSVLVLALYLNSPTVAVLYREPSYLWGVCLVLLYWISRMAMLGARGQMHDDPLVYAFTDRKSQVCGVLAAACFAAGALL